MLLKKILNYMLEFEWIGVRMGILAFVIALISFAFIDGKLSDIITTVCIIVMFIGIVFHSIVNWDSITRRK